MGEVWTPPPKFTGAQAGKKFAVSARVIGLDAAGKSIKIEPTWKSSDPKLPEVSPNQGHQVKLTVLKAGQDNILGTSYQVEVKLVKMSF